MVQIKVSTVLLATVIAALGAQNSVLAKELNGDIVGYQRSELQDPVIRAIAQELLYGRSDLTSLGYSSLTTRGLDSELETRELGAVPQFFKNVGGVVKRFFEGYWREVQDDVEVFNLRNYYHRRHIRRSSPPHAQELREASPEADTGTLTARHHLETDAEAHALHSTKRLRRRLNYGRMDDDHTIQRARRRMDYDQMVERHQPGSNDVEARSHNHLRRRMNYDQIVARSADSADELEARNHNHLRRRMDFDQMVPRDLDDLETRNHNHLRRRMDNGQIVERSSDELEARDNNPLRRRMDYDQIVARDGQTDDLELKDEELGLIPRMSWFGKSLLIYRDIANQKARLESRSDEHLFDRDLVDGVHDDW